MSTVSSNRIALAVALAALSAGCSLDTSLKNSCDQDSDCAAGHVCSQHLCRDKAPIDAAAESAPPAVGNDASSDALDAPFGVEGPNHAPDALDAADGGSEERPDAPDAASPDAPTERPPLGNSRPNYVFVTSRSFPPELHSLDAADEICSFLAVDAGLPGTFRAWLSTSQIDAYQRLGDARGWVRPDGKPVADTVEDLVQGRLRYPLSLDEKGIKVPISLQDDPPVLTGSTEFGLLAPEGTCHDYTSISGTAAAGTVNTGGRGWESGNGVDCSQPARLYCFGVDQAVPVSVPRAPLLARYAFLSAKKITLSGTLVAADSLCQEEAAAAGLTRTFRALLAASGASIADRFALSANELWARPDGVLLNTGQGTALYDGIIDAPLNVTAKGDHVSGEDYVLIGTASPHEVPTPEETCFDWRAAGADRATQSGTINRPEWWFSNGMPESCSFPYHVYCLQDPR